MGFIGVAIASLMMIVRVNAIYYGNQYVMTLIWILFLTIVGFHAWLFTTVGRKYRRSTFNYKEDKSHM